MEPSAGWSPASGYSICGSRLSKPYTSADPPLESMNPKTGTPPHLHRAPLSYQNPAFVNSPDGRLVRIISESSEPLARFRRERIQDTIVFFGSARFRAHEHASHELELELLDKPGSAAAAPDAEQPATDEEIAKGTASELRRRRRGEGGERAGYS